MRTPGRSSIEPVTTGCEPEQRATSIDLVTMIGAAAFVAVASIVGTLLILNGTVINVAAPPLFATLGPHLGPGTIPVAVLAVLAINHAISLAGTLQWRSLVGLGWLTAIGWTSALALVDGWQRGWVGPLEGSHEYLSELPRIHDVPTFLATFSDHILDFEPGSWTTHVAGHPPAATLIFWLLDRAGLGGGAWAGALVIMVGSLAAVAVPVTLRALGAPAAARRVLPFSVFLPGAVWVGVSADGLFAGVAACGLAVAVVGVTSRRRCGLLMSAAGGLLLGLLLYLSYGLILFGVIVLAALALTLVQSGVDWRNTLLRWVPVMGGTALVVLTFTFAGFRWWEGLELVQVRYDQGVAAHRPYGYFVWANIAALVLCAGPGVVAGVVRSLVALRQAQGTWRQARGPDAERWVPVVLTLAALLAIVIADLSGLSKAETERIWLPFAFVLTAGLALVPRRAAQWALATGIGIAVLVNHLLYTHW